MKQVILKEISLVNFKGVRNRTIEFNEKMTSVMGKNGSGKTTIFDAFTWLLFGKDSEDRKVFNIRTLDEQGNVIERIPHEVTAVISVDGQDITLSRRFNEKWTKKRGSAVEEYTGNEEERFFNDVPCSLKDWNEKIAAICSEQVFKFITNPLYFTSQKADVQRAMLFRMAGGVSDADVAEGNEDFKTLLAQLTGKNLEEYKREIAAKKRRVKQEIDGIPERIDERKRNAPEREDWKAVEAELDACRERLKSVDSKMADVSEQMKEFNESKKGVMNSLSDVRKKAAERRSEIEKNVLATYYEEQTYRSELKQELKRLEDEQSHLLRNAATEQSNIDMLTSKVAELREEWKNVNAEVLIFGDSDFVCPTCKRSLDIDDIETKQAEMTQNFNLKKASRLSDLSARGKAFNESIEAARQHLDVIQKHISEIEPSIAAVVDRLNNTSDSGRPDTEPMLLADEVYQKLLQSETNLEALIAEEFDSQERVILEQERQAVMADVEAITIRLSKREIIESNEKRIAELESQMKNMAVELAALEGTEFTIQEFCKARTEAIEQKINGLFQSVKFKRFEKQINGGEIETCEAMVGGVPFSDLNNAGKINAGLDIINAICKSEAITAPIFVDNAEAVNMLLDTKSQMVRLVVTDDNSLVVK
jgi:DNA repair exonuclease SbcCD ATPase subunit